MVNRKPTKITPARKAKKRKKLYRLTKGMRRQIRAYAQFMPSVEKFKTAPRITSAQLGLITKAKKRLRYTGNLLPLTAKQAAKLKDKTLLVGKGVRAIRFSNVAVSAKIKSIRVLKGDIILTSNGRTWEYHTVPGDLDILRDYGLRQLARKDVDAVALWIDQKGRAGETFGTEQSWLKEMNTFSVFGKTGPGDDDERLLTPSHSRDIRDFVRGIAVLRKQKSG